MAAEDPTGRPPVPVLLVLVVYVLPLAGVTALLVAAGLGVLAVALLLVELAVVGAVLLARRRPPRPAGTLQPSARPWLVPLAMLGVVGGVVAVAVLAGRAG